MVRTLAGMAAQYAGLCRHAFVPESSVCWYSRRVCPPPADWHPQSSSQASRAAV
ncbi:hypothetical protein [Corallococcus sp. M7]